MRRIHGAIATTLSTLLLALPASAQHAAGGSSHSGGPSGAGSGGGSAGGSLGGGGLAGSTAPSDADARTETREDGGVTRPTGTLPRRFWEVGGGLETHGLLWQTNLGGDAPNRFFNYYFLYGHVDFLGNNRIAAYAAAYERFLADSGETGMRFDDATLTYTRFVPLPYHLLFQVRASVALPTSFEAQKMSLWAEPTLGVQIGGRFFRDLLSVDLRAFNSWYLVRYREYEGGSANPETRFGLLLAGEFSMPFHRPLSAGANLYLAYYWYYDVANGAPEAGQPMPSADPQFQHQPVQLVYGGEIFARYTFPQFYGIRTDLRVSLAQGDTTLGYTSFVHDGVANLYLSYYRSSEVYGTLTIRY